MIDGPRYFNLSARISEELRDELTAYARRHRRTLSNSSAVLLEEALRRAREQECEWYDLER